MKAKVTDEMNEELQKDFTKLQVEEAGKILVGPYGLRKKDTMEEVGSDGNIKG